MNLYNLNDLLIEVALFSNFSIKFDKLCMHCFPNQAFMLFWNNINDDLTLIYPGSEFHISGSNHERLFAAGFWIFIFNLHCFLSYSVWIFNTEKDPSQLAFTRSMSTIDSRGKMWNMFKVDNKDTGTTSLKHISHRFLCVVYSTQGKLENPGKIW